MSSRTSRPWSRNALGDAGGGEGRPEPHERRLVGGRDDDDRARQALGAEVLLDELADLAAALADQASTRTSASVPRVIIDSRLDLPTPEPAKMPMRWPRPQGTSVSRARTPRVSGWSTRVRDSACGARWPGRRRTTRGRAAGRRRSAGRGRRAPGRAAPRRPAPAAAAGGAHRARRRGRRECRAACRSARRADGDHLGQHRPVARSTSTRSPTAAGGRRRSGQAHGAGHPAGHAGRRRGRRARTAVGNVMRSEPPGRARGRP